MAYKFVEGKTIWSPFENKFVPITMMKEPEEKRIRYDNMKRAIDKAFEIGLCNEFQYFITLTLDKTKIDRYDPEKIYVIGGAMMYKTLLPYCTEVLVTKVDAVGGADAYFENLDENPNFELVYESDPIETNGYQIKFTTYKNLSVKN